MQWIVNTYRGTEFHAYGSFNQTADADADKPFDQATAEALASNINSMTATSGIEAMALPLEQATQPGV
jgi:hypothetical protein